MYSSISIPCRYLCLYFIISGSFTGHCIDIYNQKDYTHVTRVHFYNCILGSL
jgi:hypothetical protein